MTQAIATRPPTDRVVYLRAQLNRFYEDGVPATLRFGSTTQKLPYKGPIDAGLATTALVVIINRASEVYRTDPKEGLRMASEAQSALSNPVPYVQLNLERIISTIKNVADFNNLPPPMLPGRSLGVPAVLALLGVGVAVMLYMRRKS